VKELENLALPRFTFGSFVNHDIDDNEFKSLLKNLE